MNDALLKLLDLPDDADEAAVITAVSALAAKLAEAETQMAALSAATPDPAQFVPLSAMAALQAELAALAAKVQTEELRKLIEPALADGRLLPAQKDWAEALGRKDLMALETFLDTAQPIAALKSTQTGGQEPPSARPAALETYRPAAGYQVDPAAAALHTQIRNYQNLHGVDYVTAAQAVGA